MIQPKTLIVFNLLLILVSCEAKYGQYLEAEPYFQCDFKTTDCGIVNQANMDTKFSYVHANIGGRNQNMLILDVSKAETQGARLITPYFHTYTYTDACLILDYYINGDGVQSLSVIQQDKMNSNIWTSSMKSFVFQRKYINVDLTRGEPRFFIEAHFEPKQVGIVAIDNLQLVYNRC